ncbi:MAG: glycosyltransferase family 4 protein [Ignavibacteria bacterium]|nr:glycosyltransferase family 4 protein [Ignavibacteria bacterium]
MFVISSIKLLLKEGHTVILASIENSPIDKESRALDIKSLHFDSSPMSLKSMLIFKKTLQEKKIDLIHTHFSKDLWLIVPALKLSGLKTPLVMTKHIGSAIEKKDPLHNLIYKRLDCAIAISEVIRQNLLDTTILGEEKVALVHNFIDTAKFIKKDASQNLRKEFQVSPSSTVVGMVGRISPGKGHEDVIEAVRIIAEEKPDIKVVFVGASQENERQYEAGLKEKIRGYGLDEYFVFTGFRKDIPELLSFFDIFLFPSHAEAFGLSLLEAMATGLPNIVCYSDGVKDIALGDVTSLTYGRGDYKTLAGHIKKLLSDPELSSLLSKNSLERVRLFSPEIFQEKIEKLYGEILLKKKKPNK